MDFRSAVILAYVNSATFFKGLLSRVVIPRDILDITLIESIVPRLLGIDIAKALEDSESHVKHRITVNQDEIFLDVGANQGQWSLWACKRSRVVLALEPNNNSFLWLVRNTKKYRNMLPMKLAAWSRDGYIRSWVSSGLGSTTFTTLSEGESETGKQETLTKATRLDTLLQGMRIPIDKVILKVDVEGAEMEVLKGAETLLANGKAVIIEVHEPGLSEKLGRINEILLANGYSVSVISEDKIQPKKWIVAKRVVSSKSSHAK